MINGIEGILLFSENAEKLAAFYKDVVGLRLDDEGEMGEKGEKYFIFLMEQGSGFAIMDHSKVKGKNKNSERIIINFEVDSIEEEFERLKKEDVPVVTEIYHVENYGQIATLEDPDGNYFQLVQVRALTN